MTFFDTHLHLPETPELYGEYIRSALSAGVDHLLICGGNMEDCRQVQDFSHLSEGIFFAAGIHPHEADNFTGSADDLRLYAEDPKFAAIGEIGIDTFYNISGLQRQIEVFHAMLSLALDLSVPAIIHCRSAADSEDAYEICSKALKDFSADGGHFELHCYAGSSEYLKRFADMGAYFGVGGMITFRRADNIREIVMQMPQDRILLETDSPYLAPVPHRGKPNCSAYVPLIAEKLAELRGWTIEETALRTTENALRFFNRKKA